MQIVFAKHHQLLYHHESLHSEHARPSFSKQPDIRREWKVHTCIVHCELTAFTTCTLCESVLWVCRRSMTACLETPSAMKARASKKTILSMLPAAGATKQTLILSSVNNRMPSNMLPPHCKHLCCKLCKWIAPPPLNPPKMLIWSLYLCLNSLCIECATKHKNKYKLHRLLVPELTYWQRRWTNQLYFHWRHKQSSVFVDLQTACFPREGLVLYGAVWPLLHVHNWAMCAWQVLSPLIVGVQLSIVLAAAEQLRLTLKVMHLQSSAHVQVRSAQKGFQAL